MATYKLIAAGGVLRDDGAVIPDDPGNRDRQAYDAWIAAGNTPAPADPLPPVPRTITPRAFRERFTADEQAAINAMAMTDAQVFDWRMRAAEAQKIDLGLPETSLGLQFLASKGLIAASRVAELLA